MMNGISQKCGKSAFPARRSAREPILRSGVIFISFLALGGCASGTRMVSPEVVSEQNLATREEALKKEIVLRREEPVVSKKGEALKGYQAFLERHSAPSSPGRAPALKRLGDLYMKEGHAQFLQDMAAYETRPSGPPPVVDYQKAIEVYNQLLRNHHDYSENDHVLYALSRAYAEMGEPAQALPLLEWLVKEYPESPYRLEAYFRLGESYFDHGKYEKAAAAYREAAGWEDPFFQDKATYKLAWAYFNVQAYPEAIDHFLSVVDQKTGEMAVFSPEEGSLVWEALTYVATAFRRLGGASAVSTYFKENGPRRYEKDLYLMMGNHDMVEGKPERGIETYRAFIEIHPLDPITPFFASYVMEALKKQGDHIGAEAARAALVRDYASHSTWYRENDEAARERSRPLIKSELHHLALSAHAKAQKHEKEEDYRAAALWYRQFLAEFPEDHAVPDIQFLLGETLMALNTQAEAGEAFEAAAYGHGGAEKKPNRKAAYAAVVAYEQVKTPAGEERFVGLSLRFAQTFPKDAQAPIVLFKVAELLFEKEAFAETAVVLGDFLRGYPKHKNVAAARKLSAHSYMKSGDFKQARIAYGAALAQLPEKNAADRKSFSELMAAAIYKEAEIEKGNGDLEKAARLFQEVSRDAPETELAPIALFEAALLYEKLEQPREAIRVYRTLSQNYKAAALAEQSSVRAGLLYEQIGERLQAAALFAAAAKSIKDEDQVRKLLWNAALHYENEAQWEKMVETLLSFTQRFPLHDDVPEALFKMAVARGHQGKKPQALKLYQAVIEKAPQGLFAAKARFEQAEHAFSGFKAISLNVPLAKSFKKKTNALKEVVDLYTKVVQTGEVTVVSFSTFRLGEVFEHFKSALLNAERPKELNAEQIEEYLFQLEEKAYPFEEKAVKAYESNVRRVQQSSGPYDEWVRRSYERLASLRPSLYRREERSERVVSHLDSFLFSRLTGFEGAEPKHMVRAKN